MSAEAGPAPFDGRAFTHECIAETAKPFGFRRRRHSWYLDRPETIPVINVQKTQFGGEVYFVNLAIWVKALGESKHPAEYRCHVRRRLYAFGSYDDWRRGEDLLDFEKFGPSLEARRVALIEALTKRGLPFLLGLAALSDLRTAWAEGRLTGMPILVSLQELLSSLHS